MSAMRIVLTNRVHLIYSRPAAPICSHINDRLRLSQVHCSPPMHVGHFQCQCMDGEVPIPEMGTQNGGAAILHE